MSYRKRIIQYEEDSQMLEDRQMKRVREIFPYDNPYEQQIESMKVILSSLNNKQNLLFQSPTGTGKSLMVMCSAAAFAESNNSQYQILCLTRTNGQINGLIKELNKIKNIDKFISKYSILAGRNNLCIKKDQFRQYIVDNNIDPNGKNLHKKYESFCTDCKKCLVKTSAKKELDIGNILNVSQSIEIDQAKYTNIKKKHQVLSTIAYDLSPEEIEPQQGQNVSQKDLACLHFGLNELLKEKEYKFDGFNKVKFIDSQRIPEQLKDLSFNQNSQIKQKNKFEFNFQNQIKLLDILEKYEEEEENQRINQIESNKYEINIKSNNKERKDCDLFDKMNDEIKEELNINHNIKNNFHVEDLEQSDINNNDCEERLPDIEDMVKIFKDKQAQCPFYFNRYIAKQSNIVFMNYNYLLNPDILTYVSANIIDRQKKQIIIFDEAHNIEQQAESQFQNKLKFKNLSKSQTLIMNVLIILRLAKQLRLLDVVKQKGLELIDKIKDSNKNKVNEKNDKEKLDNQNNYEIQLKNEQIEEEDLFIPKSLNKSSDQQQTKENQILSNEKILIIKEDEFNQYKPFNQSSQTLSEEDNLNDNSTQRYLSEIDTNIQNTHNRKLKLNFNSQKNLNESSEQKFEITNQINNNNKPNIRGGEQIFTQDQFKADLVCKEINIQQKQCEKISFDEKIEEDIIQQFDEQIKQEVYDSQPQNQQMNRVINKVQDEDEDDTEEEKEFIESLRKEILIREAIKIEDEEMNEIAVEANEQNEKERTSNEEGAEDKYEKQKRILQQFIENYEQTLTNMLNYLNKLMNYCQNRSQKSQKSECNLMSEYHFIKTYYSLFGLFLQTDIKQNKENEIKQENERKKTILEEANEVLSLKNNPNQEYENNINIFSEFSEFSFIFQQTIRYLKLKYSKESQQKAIEDILGSATYYEGNLHQLKVSMRYFANNLQPLNHLNKTKKIVCFLTKLKDFYDLSVLQQRFKKRESLYQSKYNIQNLKQYNQQCSYFDEQFNLKSPDLQKLQDYYFSIQKNDSKNDLIFTIGCLSGKYAFREIFSKLNVHSLILSSGTLEPFDILIKNLDIKFEIYSGKHVIEPQKQVFSQFIKTSYNNQSPLNFSFEKIYMDDNEIREQKRQNIMNTLDIIQNIVSALLDRSIKGGVLIFFKSYELMYNFYSAFLGSNAQKVLKDIPLFYEKPTNAQFQTDFASFKKQVSVQKKTSLFFAACRGKLAEGIDLNDDLARCVLLIGVPLWNISDPYFICKKKYVELVLKMDSNEWSRKQVIKCVNQAAGRSIRHRSDWGSVFFICEMFDQQFHPKNFKKYISKWILLGENGQKDYIEAYKQFLQRNQQQNNYKIKY